MSDTPPARPFALTADAVKGLRWSIERGRARGEQVHPVDLTTLEYLLDLADAQMIPGKRTTQRCPTCRGWGGIPPLEYHDTERVCEACGGSGEAQP